MSPPPSPFTALTPAAPTRRSRERRGAAHGSHDRRTSSTPSSRRQSGAARRAPASGLAATSAALSWSRKVAASRSVPLLQHCERNAREHQVGEGRVDRLHHAHALHACVALKVIDVHAQADGQLP